MGFCHVAKGGAEQQCQDLDVAARNALSISMGDGSPPPGSSCPADLAPTTSVVKIPSTVDFAQHLVVTIVDGTYGATIALPAVDAPGG